MTPYALVTGGTGGIGLQTATTLATLGFSVCVTGRDEAAGSEAVRTISKSSGRHDVHLVLGDLSTRHGIREVARQASALLPHLDVLVNNAGVASPILAHTADGLELNTAVNVMAPFLLTTLLWPTLKAAPAARVVTLTGGKHPKRIDLTDLQSERDFVGLAAYSQSKIVMMAVMREYAQRVSPSGITVNVCYPGQARTAMTGGVTREMLPPALRFAWPVMHRMMSPDDGQSAKVASRSSIYLATDPSLAGRTGLYVDKNSRIVEWPSAIADAQLRHQLWDQAESWAEIAGPPGVVAQS